MPRGSAPGERRGGRAKGTPNKLTIGREKALKKAEAALSAAEAAVRAASGRPAAEALPPQPQPSAAPPPPAFDSLDAKRTLAKVMLNLTAQERAKEKPNIKALQSLIETTNRVLDGITPYEHSRRSAVRPEVAAELKPDGTVNVTISSVDADL